MSYLFLEIISASQIHGPQLSYVFKCLILYSWVQSQLKNHPDELWEDGLRDYLAHASNIMVFP